MYLKEMHPTLKFKVIQKFACRGASKQGKAGARSCTDLIHHALERFEGGLGMKTVIVKRHMDPHSEFR